MQDFMIENTTFCTLYFIKLCYSQYEFLYDNGM